MKKALASVMILMVALSGALLVAGLLHFLWHQGSQPVNYSVFEGKAADVRSILSLPNQLPAQSGIRAMLAGLLVLLFLPLVRVLLGAALFALQKKYRLCILSLVIASLLVYSLMIEHNPSPSEKQAEGAPPS